MKATQVKIVALLVVLLSLSACSPRRLIVNQVANMMDTGMTAYEQDDDLQLIREAFPGNIKLLEALLENDPQNADILILLSRLYASYTLAYPEGDLDKAQFRAPGGSEEVDSLRTKVNRYYIKGAEYALRALETRHPGCREKLRNITSIEPFLSTMKKKDVPALFWYGFNLGAYINRNLDSVRAVSKAHIAEKAMKRVIALDPEYYHGSAHLFLLIYYASRPPLLGGSLEAAEWHYRELKRIAGEDFLLADLFYARFYLPLRQDRERYIQLMNRILTHSGGPESYRLFNAIAADRAEIYLAATNELFDAPAK